MKLGLIVFLSKYKLTSSSGKEKEYFLNAHIARLMCKNMKGSKDTNDLSIGFNRDIETRGGDFTNNKGTKENYQVRICVIDVPGFAEH